MPELLAGHLGEAHGVLSSALLDPQTGNGIVIIITGTADEILLITRDTVRFTEWKNLSLPGGSTN